MDYALVSSKMGCVLPIACKHCMLLRGVPHNIEDIEIGKLNETSIKSQLERYIILKNKISSVTYIILPLLS